ncbi:MAG: cyclase [Hyphomicrobiales bacterium]|nr:cyclase [Hyphomicrobiales bacterium]
MVTLFVRHRVADYQTWRSVYDEFFTTRSSVGVTAEAVYQGASDPNDVTLILTLPTVPAAQAFLENPELAAALQKAGVVGAPAAWLATKT